MAKAPCGATCGDASSTSRPGKRKARTRENASDEVSVTVKGQKSRVRPVALPGPLAAVLHQIRKPGLISGRRLSKPALFEDGQAFEPILVRQRLAPGLEGECADQPNRFSHSRKPRPTPRAVILEPAQRIDRGARVQRIVLAQQKVDPRFHRFPSRPRTPPVAYWSA
jgi:hypothetical protein